MTRQDMQAIAQLRPLLSRASALPLPPAGYDLWLPATKNLSAFTELDDGTGAPVADGPAGRWKDFSGNNYHANQNSSTAKPTIKLGVGPNGYTALRFGGDDYLDCGDVLDLGTGSMILSVVGKKTSGAGGGLVHKSAQNATVGRWGIIYFTDGNIYGLYSNAAGAQNAGVARAGGSYEALTQVIDRAGTNTLYANGVQIVQDTFTADGGENHNTTILLRIGAYTAIDNITPSTYLTGDIVEVIRYPNATPAKLTALHAYNTAKFGL